MVAEVETAGSAPCAQRDVGRLSHHAEVTLAAMTGAKRKEWMEDWDLIPCGNFTKLLKMYHV